MEKNLWLVYVALAGLAWGTYVPIIFYGGGLLSAGDPPKPLGRMLAILCVGGAYFVIGVLIPLYFLLVSTAALGDADVADTRAAIGWNHPPFEVPQEVYAGWDARAHGAAIEDEWNQRYAAYEKQHAPLAAEFRRRMAGELPASWREHCDALLAKTDAKAETIATRKASQNAIEGLAPVMPEFVGGSADLTGSNLTNWSGAKTLSANGGGNYIYYGVREFGMAAITNGMALHGGLLPFSGTFLTFSDYERNALRMAALMKLRNIFVFTHDSIGLGEDGPTHQSVEHVSSLRLMPGLDLWRPCDTVESAQAWISAVGRSDGPSALVFSRQNLPFQKRDAKMLAGIARGAYVLADCAGTPQALLLATGSEVQLALGAQAKLAAEGVRVRVVSLPSTSVFDRQDAAYRETVLPRGVPRVAVEAGVSDYWRKYVGLEGAVIGIDRYGESAPGPELFKYFGFTVDNVVAAVKRVV